MTLIHYIIIISSKKNNAQNFIKKVYFFSFLYKNLLRQIDIDTDY